MTCTRRPCRLRTSGQALCTLGKPSHSACLPIPMACSPQLIPHEFPAAHVASSLTSRILHLHLGRTVASPTPRASSNDHIQDLSCLMINSHAKIVKGVGFTIREEGEEKKNVVLAFKETCREVLKERGVGSFCGCLERKSAESLPSWFCLFFFVQLT